MVKAAMRKNPPFFSCLCMGEYFPASAETLLDGWTDEAAGGIILHVFFNIFSIFLHI
jgi:hypothetical protein